MKSIIRSSDSVFTTDTGRIIRTAARGEAIDFDKYDKEGRPNPYHGWTLDFPEHVSADDRMYGNKENAQGWYDDPDNAPPLVNGSQWRGSGDYADKAFHTYTQQHNRAIDPNREVIDPSGALGQYGVGEQDLNEYHEQGHHLRPRNQTGYPEGFSDPYGVQQRGVYSTNPDLDPWPGMERETTQPSGRGRQESTGLPQENLDNSGRVFGLWHGGHSYSEGSPYEDMESFPSLDHARRAVEGRYGNYDSHHGGERTTYDFNTHTHHLTGDTRGSNMVTLAVDRNSGMEIYSADAHPNGGWRVHIDEPSHYIWVNADGDAVVGREHGDYGDDDYDDESDWSDSADSEDNDLEEQGSHAKQQHLINAGFEYYPHEYNGDSYSRDDHNGNSHVVRAPNPRYGTDTWHYEFHPSNEQDRDPYAPRNASTDGPRSLSFSANDPEEAYNLHQNLGNDLSELASRGFGTHKVDLGLAGIRGNAREDNRAIGGSNHSIEGHRRDADDSGFDRVFKTSHGVWAAHHVPDSTPTDRHPPVSVIAEGRSRRDVLDAADRHDARAYLEDRGGPSQVDEESGHETWQIPHRNIGSAQFDVTMPGESGHSPRWTVTHKNDGRIVTHTSHPTWVTARNELMGRI